MKLCHSKDLVCSNICWFTTHTPEIPNTAKYPTTIIVDPGFSPATQYAVVLLGATNPADLAPLTYHVAPGLQVTRSRWCWKLSKIFWTTSCPCAHTLEAGGAPESRRYRTCQRPCNLRYIAAELRSEPIMVRVYVVTRPLYQRVSPPQLCTRRSRRWTACRSPWIGVTLVVTVFGITTYYKSPNAPPPYGSIYECAPQRSISRWAICVRLGNTAKSKSFRVVQKKRCFQTPPLKLGSQRGNREKGALERWMRSGFAFSFPAATCNVCTWAKGGTWNLFMKYKVLLGGNDDDDDVDVHSRSRFAAAALLTWAKRHVCVCVCVQNYAMHLAYLVIGFRSERCNFKFAWLDLRWSILN